MFIHTPTMEDACSKGPSSQETRTLVTSGSSSVGFVYWEIVLLEISAYVRLFLLPCFADAILSEASLIRLETNMQFLFVSRKCGHSRPHAIDLMFSSVLFKAEFFN